jgi:hypothetical protein
MLHGDALFDRAWVNTALGHAKAAADDLEQAIDVYRRKGIRPATPRSGLPTAARFAGRRPMRSPG